MMNEYDLHSLIVSARAEFDIATAIMLFASLAFMGLATSSAKPWDKGTKRLFVIAYIVTATFLFIRVVASIIRFGKLNQIFEKGDPEFIVGFIPLQLPTAILRVMFFVLMAWLTIRILRRQGSDEDGKYAFSKN